RRAPASTGRAARRRRRLIGLLLVLLLVLLGPPAGLTPRDPVGHRGRRTSDGGRPGPPSDKSWHLLCLSLVPQTESAASAASAASSASAAANNAWTGI